MMVMIMPIILMSGIIAGVIDGDNNGYDDDDDHDHDHDHADDFDVRDNGYLEW